MSDKNRPQTDDAGSHEEHDGWSMRTKLILGGIGVIGFIGLYLLAVYWIPGEWARFITGITNQSTSTSWLLGLAVGFSFSLLPILVFLMGMRMRRSWRGIIGWLLVALVVALPNILTLGVRFGTRAASKAARTTMFTDAPGFTVASYVGIALGIATGLWVAWITISRRRAKRKADQLAAKTREHEQADTGSSPADDAAHSSHSTADDGSTGSADHGADANDDRDGDNPDEPGAYDQDADDSDHTAADDQADDA